jgi:serine/threonine protein kinase
MPSHDDRDPQDHSADPPMLKTSIGSGLLAQQPTLPPEEAVAVAKVCPQCGGEYETGDRFCPKDGSPLRPKSGGDPLVGRVIADRYLILAQIGQGGMGRVYLAEHVKMNRQCAIKVMNPSLIHDTESAARFAREVSNAARILHSNVAAVFDYGEADKIIYLVMEYVDGESLSAIVAREGALDPRRAIDIARQVADGLAAAHDLGIVHRDLKLDNVIVSRNRAGREIPKVVDFGIAKALSDMPEDALTRSGLVIGTPEYMSPEQLLGDPVDARADIYSLGCMLYQMLTGEQAFAAESREQMIRRRLHEPPPHVRDVLPDLPRRLDTLIVHMLARSPAERLASAAEARDALDPALTLGGWDPKSLKSLPKTSRAALTVTGHVSDPTLQPTIQLPRQRASVIRVAAGTILGAAALFAGLMLWSGRDVGTTPAQTTPAAGALKTDSTTLNPGQLPLSQATQTSTTQPILPGQQPSSPGPVAPTQAAPQQQRPQARKPGRADSITAAALRARLDSTPLRKTPDSTDAIQRAIEPFVSSFKTHDIDAVGATAPIPPDLRQWMGDLFGRVDNIRATAHYGSVKLAGDSAEVAVALHLSYSYKGGIGPGTAERHYRVKLVRRDARWEITELVPQP